MGGIGDRTALRIIVRTHIRPYSQHSEAFPCIPCPPQACSDINVGHLNAWVTKLQLHTHTYNTCLQFPSDETYRQQAYMRTL